MSNNEPDLKAPHVVRERPIMKWLAMGAIVSMALGLFMLVGPAGRVPLMDGNRVLLAETSAEGYCAAEAHFKQFSQMSFDDCVAESSRPHDVEITEVLASFCAGVVDQGWPGTRDECKTVVEAGQLWPTREWTPRGWISNTWNRRFPYPGSLVGVGAQNTDNSRTGERDGNIRDGEIERP